LFGCVPVVVERQPLLDEQQVPVLDDPHRPERLPFVFVLQVPQTPVQILRDEAIQFGPDFVNPFQQPARLGEQRTRFA